MKKLSISAFALHIIAMTLMLCDHMWATVVPGSQWMTDIGRIAFPIFAFMIVEGFYHTRNLKKYVLRLLIFALLSEVPFNFMYGGSAFYPFHQNVLWTFLISVGCITLIEKVRVKGKLWKTILVAVLMTVAGAALGFILMVDYFGFGVLMVLVFYYFRGRKWYHFAGQLICLCYINFVLMRGLVYPVNIFGHTVEIAQQGFAVLALIPIWMYRGERGPYNKVIQFIWYAFYPVHMAVLALLFSVL